VPEKSKFGGDREGRPNSEVQREKGGANLPKTRTDTQESGLSESRKKEGGKERRTITDPVVRGGEWGGKEEESMVERKGSGTERASIRLPQGRRQNRMKADYKRGKREKNDTVPKSMRSEKEAVAARTLETGSLMNLEGGERSEGPKYRPGGEKKTGRR